MCSSLSEMAGTAVILQLILLFYCGKFLLKSDSEYGCFTEGRSGDQWCSVEYSTQPGELTPHHAEGALEVKGIRCSSTVLTALERGTACYIWVVHGCVARKRGSTQRQEIGLE